MPRDKTMKVSCEFGGRLGNNMFQAATVLGYAYKYDVTPVFMQHEYLKTVEKKMNVEHIYNEPCHAYMEIPYYDNILLVGYFQSEKYFKDARNVIRSAFIKKTYPVKDYIAVHVRRGDYLQYPTKHPIPGLDNYYKKAMVLSKIKDCLPYDGKVVYKIVGINPINYLIFSDDKEYCKEHFNGCIFSWELYPGLNDYEYLQLMASCGGHIIANSSYSWWGAWLSENNNVICPSYDNWFGPGNSHLCPHDIIPDNWTQIKY
jgi:hypothetical protein